MNIYILPPDQILKYWPTLSMYLEQALEHGQQESSLVDYMKKILDEKAQCWAIANEDGFIVGAALTQTIQYAQYKSLHIIGYSGSNFEEQSKVFPTVERFAREIGCKSIEQWGRPGWAKTLPKYVPGFKQTYVVMKKDLEGTHDETMENK